MKLSLAFLTAVAATPEISLDLEGMGYKTWNKPVLKSHAFGKTNPDGLDVGRRQQWTLTCPARNSNGVNCGIPVGKAYDHHDGKLDVTRTVMLVDTDSIPKNKKVSVCVDGKRCKSKINYRQRSTYRVLYDACDKSGNCAEQPEVILVLDDKTKPIITPCSTYTKVEAATNWKLCGSTIVTDNIDSSAKVLKTLTYTVSHECTKGVCHGFKDNNLMCNKCSYKKARSKITTLLTGSFKIVLDAHDFAGKYGIKGSNNYNMKMMTVVVRDTTRPKITVKGARPATHECATTYKDMSATAADTLDDKLKRLIRVFDNSALITPRTYIGSKIVTFTATDSHKNKAIKKTRKVNIVDTTRPVIRIVGKKLIEHESQTKFRNPGSKCSDSCCAVTGKCKTRTTTRWVGKKFTDKDTGKYVMEYKCKDSSKLSKDSTVRRTWKVVDKRAPQITVVGKDSITLEASTTAEYTDAGATCSDYVDADLSKYVRISGDLVDYRTPGTYYIKYNCKDFSGNKAHTMDTKCAIGDKQCHKKTKKFLSKHGVTYDTATRRVVVKDTTCPKLARTGPATLQIEAGFPYVDQGAKASDTLDGVITKNIKVSGDTVNTRKAFYAFRSCKAIKKNDKKAKSGQYTITTGKVGALKRKTVYCDMKYQQSYFTCNNCARVIPYGKNGGDCWKHGMKMATFGVHAKASAKLHYTKNGREESKYFPKDARATSNYYLCSPRTNKGAVNSFHPKHGDISHAEQGKYIITYTVKDKAGNIQCGNDPKHRTVVVKDTLPPVISLHYKGKLIHTGDSSKRGIKNVKNPAGMSKYNPFFMAEATSVNGWMIGAIASAVAGVALLATSTKKATSVPV